MYFERKYLVNLLADSIKYFIAFNFKSEFKTSMKQIPQKELKVDKQP